MPTDIFPDIDIPVISVVWNYPGLSPEEMEKRIVNNYERGLTTTVNDIEHIESQSLTGISVIKIFFQPGAKIEAATAQVTAISQTAVRQMPPGTTPPFIIRYSASNVPILQIALESDSLSEQQLFDYGTNFIRADVATIQGAQMPWPYGGKQRQIMIDIDPQRLYAWGLSPRDVNNALGLQNVIVPTGTAKIGRRRVPHRPQREPRAARPDRRHPHQGRPRHDGLHPRRRQRARRLRAADEHRPRRGQEVRAHVDPQAGERQHARRRQAHPRHACRRRSRGSPRS